MYLIRLCEKEIGKRNAINAEIKMVMELNSGIGLFTIVTFYILRFQLFLFLRHRVKRFLQKTFGHKIFIKLHVFALFYLCI